MCVSTRFCHICGFRIPGDIVSEKHHLYGTVDHVIPLGRGGLDRKENRKPAHRFCNQKKADRIELEEYWIFNVQGAVATFLRQRGITVSSHDFLNARRRIGIPTQTQKDRLIALEVARWHDDGAPCYDPSQISE